VRMERRQEGGQFRQGRAGGVWQTVSAIHTSSIPGERLADKVGLGGTDGYGSNGGFWQEGSVQ
jgi:hypothetical protein